SYTHYTRITIIGMTLGAVTGTAPFFICISVCIRLHTIQAIVQGLKLDLNLADHFIVPRSKSPTLVT
ncbi:hypothetical protein J7985_23290, partial [Vibrio parahaemolyticus]|nr:hypothetical protein [Vibrio parahaemolyticus]